MKGCSVSLTRGPEKLTVKLDKTARATLNERIFGGRRVHLAGVQSAKEKEINL